MIQLHWEEGDLDVAIKGKEILKVRLYYKTWLLEFEKKIVLVI